MYSRARLYERVQLSVIRAIGVFLSAVVATGVYHRVLLSEPSVPWKVYVGPALLAAGVLPMIMWPTTTRTGSGWVATMRDSLFGVAIGVGVLLAIGFFYRSESYSRGTVLVFIPFTIFFLVATDRVHRTLIRAVRSHHFAGRRVLVVGTGDCGTNIGAALDRDPAYYQLVGYASTGTGSNVDVEDRVVGSAADLADLVKNHSVDEVIIALPSSTEAEILDLVGTCIAAGADWKFVPRMEGILPDRSQFDVMEGIPLVGQRGNRLVGHNWYLKRALDVCLAGAILMFTAPLMAAIALAVKATSTGPVLFRQERIGLNGQPFVFLKFRSMRSASATTEHSDYTADWILGKTQPDGGVYKLTTDPRITAVGKAIRSTSLDELPQLWNVIRGDMSLVGPRPPIEYEVQRYTEWHRKRLSVPPGMTGLWQVSGRNRLSFDDMVRLDIEYMEMWSLRRDLAILLKTIPAVVFDRGR